MTKLKFKANLQGLFFLKNQTLENEGPAIALREAYEQESYVHHGASYIDFDLEGFALKDYPKDVSNKIRFFQEEEDNESLEITSPGYPKVDVDFWNGEGYTVVNGELLAEVFVVREEFLMAEDYDAVITQAIRQNELKVFKAYIICNLNRPNGLLMTNNKVIRDFRALQYDEFNVEGNSFKLD